MNQQTTYYLTKASLLTLCFALGCGSGSGGGALQVDSELVGVYQIDRYQGSEDGCDQPMDIPGAPPFLVLYGFRPKEDLDEVRLGGTFCSDVDTCRQVAQDAPEPTLGYSFIQGSDQSGWQGWGISSGGGIGDECRVDVQAHTLTSPAAEGIRIETRTVETIFPATVGEGGEAICSVRDALTSLNPSLPCKALLLLEATLEARL